MKYLNIFGILFCMTFCIMAENALPPYVGDNRSAQVTTSNTAMIEVAPISIDEITITPITTHTITSDTIEIPDLQKGLDGIAENIKVLNNLMIDKRNMLNDAALHTPDNTVVKRWISIYQNQYAPVTKVNLPSGIRMIAEVRMPQNQDQARILKENLDYRKAQGYNSILVTFYGTEEISDLTDLILYLKNYGFKVWFAFSGKEDLKESVFMDPDRYAIYLQSLAAVSDGFISHWRRTSSHLFIQDDAFMAYTAQWVRIGNPEIPILGEIYFGETASISQKVDWIKQFKSYDPYYEYNNLVIRMVQGGSGYLISNFSTTNINVEGVMKNLLGDVKEPKYILITGPSVYFLSSKKTSTTYEQDLQAIKKIEERWLQAGCTGVIVTHGDGSDTGAVSDNMSQYSYKNIKQ